MESFLAQQTEGLEHAMWTAFRALDERVSLASRLADEARRQHDAIGEQRFSRLRAEAAAQQEQVRRLLHGSGASGAPQ
jgi:two-component system, chemotaxis family, protein-glutamate methylesterase/glutaminase